LTLWRANLLIIYALSFAQQAGQSFFSISTRPTYLHREESLVVAPATHSVTHPLCRMQADMLVAKDFTITRFGLLAFGLLNYHFATYRIPFFRLGALAFRPSTKSCAVRHASNAFLAFKASPANLISKA